MKISKQNRKRHLAALELLAKETLNWDEQQFFFDNYFESADFDISRAGAFFTPSDLALDTALELGQCDAEIKVVDLCAGIGVLSWAVLTRCPNAKITAIEQNPEWVKIGKKLLPEVNWICADLADLNLQELGYFDCAISNPPFGNVPSLKKLSSPRYTGSEAHYKVIDIACVMANSVAAIIPQQSCSFAYSGVRQFRETSSKQLERFTLETQIELGMNIGIDTTCYASFKATNIKVEVVSCESDGVCWEDFNKEKVKVDTTPNVVQMAVAKERMVKERSPAPVLEHGQMNLFG